MTRASVGGRTQIYQRHDKFVWNWELVELGLKQVCGGVWGVEMKMAS